MAGGSRPGGEEVPASTAGSNKYECITRSSPYLSMGDSQNSPRMVCVCRS